MWTNKKLFILFIFDLLSYIKKLQTNLLLNYSLPLGIKATRKKLQRIKHARTKTFLF